MKGFRILFADDTKQLHMYINHSRTLNQSPESYPKKLCSYIFDVGTSHFNVASRMQGDDPCVPTFFPLLDFSFMRMQYSTTYFAFVTLLNNILTFHLFL